MKNLTYLESKQNKYDEISEKMRTENRIKLREDMAEAGVFRALRAMEERNPSRSNVAPIILCELEDMIKVGVDFETNHPRYKLIRIKPELLPWESKDPFKVKKPYINQIKKPLPWEKDSFKPYDEIEPSKPKFYSKGKTFGKKMKEAATIVIASMVARPNYGMAK